MTVSGHAGTKGPARRRSGPFLRCALAAALLSIVPARADAGEPGVEVAASAGLRHVRYEEWGPYGDLLDSEDGWIPTVGVRAGLRVSRLVGELSGRLARGDLAYHGLTQSGAWVHGTSAATFLDGRVRAGGVVDPWGRLTLLAGVAARRWNRDIHGTTLTSGGTPIPVRGLSEIYSWYELDAAARASLVATPRLSWLAEVRVLRTVAPHLSVGWNGSDVGLALGARTGWGAETEVQLTLRPGLFLSAGGSVERLGFGASRTVPVARTWMTEPDSDTWGVRVELGIGARL